RNEASEGGHPEALRLGPVTRGRNAERAQSAGELSYKEAGAGGATAGGAAPAREAQTKSRGLDGGRRSSALDDTTRKDAGEKKRDEDQFEQAASGTDAKNLRESLGRDQEAVGREIDRLYADLERHPGETPSMMLFRYWGDNAFVEASESPQSTFGADVDTASY